MDVYDQERDQERQQGSSGGSPQKQQYNGATYHDTPIETNQKISSEERSRLPEPYDFRFPDKVEVDRLNGKYSKAADFVERRINLLTKIASELLDSEEKFLEEENKFIEKAAIFIDENAQKFKELLDKEVEQKAKLEIALSSRQVELQDAQLKSDLAKIKLREIESIISEQAKELIRLNSFKETTANDIQGTMIQFKKIRIRDPKDAAHELFKWFLRVVYNESPAKYDFDNFKNEVLKKDKGVDFVQRLKGFRVFAMGKDEVNETLNLLKLEKEVTDRINHKRKPLTAVTASFGYVKIVDKINQIMDNMHKREVELDACAKKIDITGAELEKFRSRKIDAEANIQIADKAIQTFEAAFKLFITTGQKCRERHKFTSENLPGLKKSMVKPKKTETKTETVVEGKAQDEETAFGNVSNQETHQHKQVRSQFESNVDELPASQKEGCKCTIF